MTRRMLQGGSTIKATDQQVCDVGVREAFCRDNTAM